MEPKDIKPIPKYIETAIRKLDLQRCPQQKGLRFYAYLTKIKGELVKITVAMRNYRKNPAFMKQVAVHGVYSDNCLVRDMEYCFLGLYAYRVGWYDEGVRYPNGRPFYNDGIWYPTAFKYYNPYATVINPEYALKIPDFKYSAVDIYNPGCIITYLRLYLEFPQMEYLVKFGFRSLATKKTILRRLGKDKKFIGWLLQHKTELTTNYYYTDVILRAYTQNKALDVLQREKVMKLRFVHDYDYKRLRKRFPIDFVPKLIPYLADNHIAINSYIDYFNACEYLELDMTLPKTLFPHDFKYWHDTRIDQYATAKAIKDEEARKALYSKFATVAEKYLTLEHEKRSAFICIIARSPAELIREGNILHHCVGKMQYDQRMIREESLIFFIRNKAAPNTPFVTVEYSLSKHKILQCLGEHNNRPDEKVLHYVNDIWLPYANKQLKQIAA